MEQFLYNKLSCSITENLKSKIFDIEKHCCHSVDNIIIFERLVVFPISEMDSNVTDAVAEMHSTFYYNFSTFVLIN